MPIFQLLYCTLNPVNLLLFTLSPSSCSLCLYLSLSHTLMLIHSPSVSLLLSPSSSLQHIFLSHALTLFCVLSLFLSQPFLRLLFITVSLCIDLCRSRLYSDSDSFQLYMVQSDTQGLSMIGLSLLVYRCAAGERDRQKERR